MPQTWLSGRMRIAAPISAAALCAGLLAAPPAQAAPVPDNGSAVATLPACAQATPFGEALVPGCSYVALPKAGGGTYYAYITSTGAVRMTGSLAGGGLRFPVSGQSWPGIIAPGGLVTVDVRRAEVTGALAAGGAMELTVPYNVTLSVGVLGSCTVKGTANASSAATDSIGGATGRAYDSGSQGFAVAGTSTPSLQGSLCDLADEYLDLSRGVGWYLDGSLEVTPDVVPVVKQTASVKPPARIKRKGRTVLLKRPVVTNAKQRAKVSVRWGTKLSAKGSKRKFARVTTKRGKVVIRTTGRATRLFVRMTLRAPATSGYESYKATRLWVVR